jgi:hypothetical protein
MKRLMHNLDDLAGLDIVLARRHQASGAIEQNTRPALPAQGNVSLVSAVQAGLLALRRWTTAPFRPTSCLD